METEARKFALLFSLAGPQTIEVFNMFEFEAPVEVKRHQKVPSRTEKRISAFVGRERPEREFFVVEMVS